MKQPPLNPDGLRAAEELMILTDRITKINYLDAERIISAYLAVAQPEVQANSKQNQNLEFVNSVEELDALPPESYVQGWDGFKHAKTHSGDWVLCVDQTCGAHDSGSIELPARVLYRPEVNDA